MVSYYMLIEVKIEKKRGGSMRKKKNREERNRIENNKRENQKERKTHI